MKFVFSSCKKRVGGLCMSEIGAGSLVDFSTLLFLTSGYLLFWFLEKWAT